VFAVDAEFLEDVPIANAAIVFLSATMETTALCEARLLVSGQLKLLGERAASADGASHACHYK
jgi:hypothetical protein